MRAARVILLALLVAPACPAAEQPLVSLQARDEPLRAVLKKLTAGTQTVITVEPKVPDVLVRLALRNVTVDHGLRLVIKQAGKNLPQLEYEVADHGFRVYFATPVAPLVEKGDPSKFTVTVRKQPPLEVAQPETKTVEAGSEAGTEPVGAQTQPNSTPSGSQMLGQQQVPPPYLVDPVAAYYAREALIPKVPYYRPGYLPVIAKTTGKRRRDVPRQPYFFRQQVLSGQTFPGRYGGAGRGKGRSKNNSGGGATGGGSGPGGFSRRPL